MICGVPQESIPGYLLCNIAFDAILKEEVSSVVSIPRVSIVYYTDNTLVVTAEDDISTLGQKVNTTREAMTHWIESAGLS